MKALGDACDRSQRAVWALSGYRIFRGTHGARGGHFAFQLLVLFVQLEKAIRHFINHSCPVLHLLRAHQNPNRKQADPGARSGHKGTWSIALFRNDGSQAAADQARIW